MVSVKRMYYKGISKKQISRELKVSKNTVKRLLYCRNLGILTPFEKHELDMAA
ncbi:helix-turn-helix domain-containing protein [Proteiniclasticum ruminis]|uniref:helix-turn-helix domain-containing protein n=1 Tax=Proteiniclasticum ruminis TaxID=398199 RepID=UPI0009F1865D|nr:helix-turn-helix domain-containing protein [Proteiniclasticum ruminis]